MTNECSSGRDSLWSTFVHYGVCFWLSRVRRVRIRPNNLKSWSENLSLTMTPLLMKTLLPKNRIFKMQWLTSLTPLNQRLRGGISASAGIL